MSVKARELHATEGEQRINALQCLEREIKVNFCVIKDNSSYKCHKEEFVRLKLSHKYSTTVTLIPSSGRGIEA